MSKAAVPGRLSPAGLAPVCLHRVCRDRLRTSGAAPGDLGLCSHSPVPGLPGRMFIGAEKRLDVGFHAAQARRGYLARGGLLRRASHDAYGEWETGLARLSPLNATPAMSKLVAVRFRDMVTHADSVLWAMRWEAIDPGGTLIPALDADIRLTPAGEQATWLAVSGAYRPPLGSTGTGMDRVSLHPIAQSMIQAFTSHIGAAIAPSAAPL